MIVLRIFLFIKIIDIFIYLVDVIRLSKKFCHVTFYS